MTNLDNVGLLVVDDNRIDMICARISTHKKQQRGNLDRQIQTVPNFVIDKNPKPLQVITDVGSGLNNNRKGLKLISLIQNKQVNRVFISYKDCLTRFGFNYLRAIAEFHDTQIIVISSEVEDKSISEELAEDIISIIHSFSGKMYGHVIKERINY